MTTFHASLVVVLACGSAAALAERSSVQAQAPPAYVGSAACSKCHGPIYERWKQTRMANVVRDPREHPEAIISDFTTPNPAVTFTKDQIAFVYGGKFKQRYFRKSGDDYFPLPAQWDVTNRLWRAYGVTGATSGLCDGCHSVNYDIKAKTVTEWNVGCERCHGPGSDHAARPARATIVNPARLDTVAAVDVCVQCHSEGHPTSVPAGGGEIHWPIGFRVGLRLGDFWRLEPHRPGETGGMHYADGTAAENRMQGNDYVQSLMYRRGVACFSCHDPHGTTNNADLVKSSRLICLTCHSPSSPAGPHTSTIEQHTHHQPGSAGSECVNCHMPKIARMLGDVYVRSHTFKFIPPALTESSRVPNACTTCHQDKSNAWATAALNSWPEFSPWRVAQ